MASHPRLQRRLDIHLVPSDPVRNDKDQAKTAMSRAIAVVIHPGFQLLDAAGPTTAFEIAERFRPGSYAQTLLAPGGGTVESSSGLSLSAEPMGDGPFDTVIVSGGEIVRSMPAVHDIVGWLKRVKTRRVASVCSGAFLLAAAGLLDGRRATTHWASTEHFARRYPNVKLDAERIFIRDGDVWTSAGISAGIDLALALIEDDLGEDVARRTAQQLVVHRRRPGGQSQFSALIDLGGRTGRFAELVAWMRDHIGEAMTVERLADRAAMSPRNFARAFAAETGMTPAKAVERLSLETARTAVEAGHAPLERAFLRGFGQPPQALRRAARV
jgi:transcriptional regulator GlxA family with amidase domain